MSVRQKHQTEEREMVKTEKLSKAEEVPLKNMAYRIAVAMLKQHGEYTCVVGGKKRHFKLA